MTGLELTRLAKHGGPLTKRISLTPDGNVHSDGSTCFMAEGEATRLRLNDIAELAGVIDAMQPHEALALGALRDDQPDAVRIASKEKLATMNGAPPPHVVTRSLATFVYRAKLPALALLDLDIKGMPPEVAARFGAYASYWDALVAVLPLLKGCAYVCRRSTSAGLYRSDTGERFAGSGGAHIYVPVADGADIARFLKQLHARCWLAGLGWKMLGAGGQLLDRSIVDRAVGSPERLVFEGAPVLDAPLAQDTAARAAAAHPGDALDSVAACPPLTILENLRLQELVARENQRLAPAATLARAEYIAERALALSQHKGIPLERARHIIARRCAAVLLPSDGLPFDNGALAHVTVGDVLDNPARFDGETLADPLEGLGYGRNVAKIMRDGEGWPWVFSFAHGKTIYRLRYDSAALEAKLKAAPKESVADTFARLLPVSEIDEREAERLSELVVTTAGIGKRALSQMVKRVRGDHSTRQHERERERQLAERNDPRPRIPAPADDAEWLPQMEVLNGVLGTSKAAEPPMRDLDGYMAEVRARRVVSMHELMAEGANSTEKDESRLPAPEQLLLTRLDDAQLAEMIERHVDYVDAKGRSVHLAGPFVKHFAKRSDDALPTVHAVALLPIVLRGGEILSARGLLRERGIVFRVPEQLLALLPKRDDCTAAKVAEATRYLIDEWLCDVAADFAGMCVAIAAALTIIERHLLPERPAFFVRAGQRGSGKTTLIHMIAKATLGWRATAAAWSPSEEERRKSMFAYLSEGVPLLVWDNIERGAAISCPSIEKALTAETYSDRVLGLSESRTVPATTVQIFTGNNIEARGDLASRTLTMRLRADRPDPENRPFTHSDPLAWTAAHRGEILAALYTVLIGNPKREKGETRFKVWWQLVGSAVEHAAAQYAKFYPDKAAPPIKFATLFLDGEGEDEQASSLATVLTICRDRWPDGAHWRAADLKDFITPFYSAPPAGGHEEAERQRERERGDLLRGSIAQACGKELLGVSARTLTWALKPLVDVPVLIDDEPWALRKLRGRKADGFWVEKIEQRGLKLA